MTSSKFFTIPAVVAGALGMGNAVARAAEPTTDELMKQIEQLQTKVQQLETKQTAAASGQQVDATVNRVLEDAQKRSQLLQMEGFTAGWNDGFKIQSADGNFLLQPYFQFQFRNVTTFREDAKNGDWDTQNGFEIRRMKFGFKGNAFTPDLTYNFRWATDRDGGSVFLENAYIQYFFSDDMAFKVGQWKDNWTHEETTSSAMQLAVDRSLLNELLGGGQTDYIQGVSLIYAPRDGKFRAEIAFHDGANSDNTDFQDDPGGGGSGLVIDGSLGTQGTNFGFSGRFEFAAMGGWREYEDFTAMGNKEDLLVIGAGFDWTQASSNNVYFHTVDVQWEPASVAGLGVYAAYVGAYSDFNDAVDDDFYNWGLLVQAGYMLNDQWEIFGRYDYTSVDDSLAPAGAEDNFSEITAGVNYYMKGHAAKVTIDFTYLPDGVPPSSSIGADLTGIGFQGTGDGDDEFVIRGQFQLLL